MLARRDTSHAAATAKTTKAEVSLSAHSELYSMGSIWKTKNKNKNKRRFNDEQIKTLESLFEAESRPELHRKQQLANELGLQPRQVAIWFQNKRARSKSKVIEQEYNMLKTSYDTLASKLDSLKKENRVLHIQLQRLRNLLGEPKGSKNRIEPGKSFEEEYDNTDTNGEAEQKPNLLSDYNHHQISAPLCGDSGENVVEYFGEAVNLVNIPEVGHDSSFSSSRNWRSIESNFESSYVLDNPSCGSE